MGILRPMQHSSPTFKRTHTLSSFSLPIPTTLKLPTLPNITHPKPPRLHPLPHQRLLQLPRRLHNILLSKHPRAPMHTQRLPALRIHKDIRAILGIRMHRAEHPARLVCADGDEPEIKGTAVRADLCEGGADGEVCVGGAVVVDAGVELRDCAVACVAVEM